MKRKKTLEQLRQGVAEAHESATAHWKLGTALLHAGKSNEAEASLLEAVELEPGLGKAWVNIGGIRMGRWDFAGCIEANDRALEHHPELLEAHYNRGLGFLYLGDATAVIACFRKVLELEPGSPGGHYHLAVGLLAAGEIEAAEKELAISLELGYSPQPEFVRAIERTAGRRGEPNEMIEV